jgi:hypothetical protein
MAWPTTTTISGAFSLYSDDDIYGAQSWTIAATAPIGIADLLAGATSHYFNARYISALSSQSTLPRNATIIGIQVTVTRYQSSGTGTIADSSVRLMKNGRYVGQNKAASGNWPGSATAATYGGPTDMWGLRLTPDDLQAQDFGFSIAVVESSGANTAIGRINSIAINIYYVNGYDGAPQVAEAEVQLFGMPYPLPMNGNKVSVTMQNILPQKVVTNRDYDRNSSLYHSTYTVNDLRAGAGLYRYYPQSDTNPLDRDILATQYNRYFYTEAVTSTSAGAETRFPGSFTLPPKVTNYSTPGSGTMTTGIDFNGTWVFSLASAIYTLSEAGTYTLKDMLPATPRDACLFNSRVFYALSSTGSNNGYSYWTGTGAATDVASPNVMNFKVWDGRIWALDNAGVLYYSTTGDSGTWITRAALPYPYNTSTYTKRLTVYNDASGDPIIYAVTRTGLFSYDAVNNKWFETNASWYINNQASDPSVMYDAVWNGSLYISGDRSVFRYTVTNSISELVDIGPSQFQNWPSDSDGAISGLCATNDGLYILTNSFNYGDSAVNYNTVMFYNGLGWHHLWTDRYTDSTPRNTMSIGVYRGTSTPYILWTAVDSILSVAYTSVYGIPVIVNNQNPLFSTVRTYESSSAVILPWFDADYHDQVKIAQQLRVKVSGASANAAGTELCYVAISYRLNFDNTGSWTELSPYVYTNGETVIPIGTVYNNAIYGSMNPQGLEFNSIQFRLNFVRNSTTTSAPKLESMTLDFIRKEEVLRGYQVTLDLSNEYKGRSPQQMVDHIWSHMNASQFGTFSYRDDAGNTRSYVVKVIKPEGNEMAGHDFGSTYTLNLLEIGDN